ncbi:MAG: hypothetical protein U0M06_02575, partial [Clostridia bacterium]|nr:hypothetical protein [Clostridia bacterium]
INYTVFASRIEPNTKQDGGVQGDHNKVRLDFKIDDSLWASLNNQEQDGKKLYYRFDLYNGEGATESTVPQSLESNEIIFGVTEWLTRFGGVGKVELVITLYEEGKTHLEIFNIPALLQFKNRPTGSGSKEGGYTSITTLAISAKESAEKAENAKNIAEQKAVELENVKNVIEKGATVVFEGNRSSGAAEILEQISTTVTEGDPNAVSGGAVFNYCEALKINPEALLNDLISDIYKKVYPVGCIYWSRKSDSPEKLFRGTTWEQIKDTFLFAAGDDFKAGDTGGETTVTLTEEHLPPHQHTGFYINNKLISLSRKDLVSALAIPWGNGKGYPADNFKTGITGGAKEFSIMPPYEVAYCWVRTK